MTRTAKPIILESEVLDACLQFLRLKGCNPSRRNVGAMFDERGQYVRFNDPGSADITATVPGSGRRLEVETKRTGYRPRGKRERKHFADQIAWLNERNEEGAIGIMVDRLEWLERLWPAIEAGARFHIAADGTVEVKLTKSGEE